MYHLILHQRSLQCAFLIIFLSSFFYFFHHLTVSARAHKFEVEDWNQNGRRCASAHFPVEARHPQESRKISRHFQFRGGSSSFLCKILCFPSTRLEDGDSGECTFEILQEQGVGFYGNEAKARRRRGPTSKSQTRGTSMLKNDCVHCTLRAIDFPSTLIISFVNLLWFFP